MIKKRRPVLAGALSLLAPGIGHVYAGDPKTGLLLIAIEYGVFLLSGIFGLLSTFYGIVFITLFTVGIYIFAIVSSVKLTLQKKEYTLKSYNRWYWYLLLFIFVAIIANIMFSFRGVLLGYETYSISSKSMEPTLEVGDFITVDTRYFSPKLDDVIIFIYPINRKLPFVMRVAAIGNDTVSIENGNIILNGNAVDSLSVPEDRRLREYSISMKKRRIPENEIFLLGDWRDNSNDSRFWGTVPIEDIIGKVTYIWYSKNTSKIGTVVE